ncbi:MAG TPA: HAMP domain-containing sensor histidine kinase, partial [Acidimicrobiales bacterium]
NLLENAARHGDGVGGTRVDAQLSPATGMVEVRVTDHGPGIPAELAEAVFQPEVRGTTTASGDGLGLAISRGIVAAHGGTLALEPATTGTTMLVILPVEPDVSAESVGDDG